MSVPAQVVKLVDQFRDQFQAAKSPQYKEAWGRMYYIDPFFKALGWDVHNENSGTLFHKEVVHEDTLRVEGAMKAPDYCFYTGGARKFFVEAKKPSVNLFDGRSAAFQVRRYAWSAKLPLSVLTDFEELAIYDCRVRPQKEDKASTARSLYITYEEYPDRWDEVASLFSKEAVLSGSLDTYAQDLKKKRGIATVDDVFLKEMEGWREILAKDLAKRNPSLTRRELNYAVQMTIDRIVFLRICEDRGIEDYGKLEDLVGKDNVYGRLCDAFKDADDKYNSGLFHFREEKGRDELPDDLTLKLQLSDQPLKKIIKGLYYPESPYQFSVMPVEIMGQVYEQFLGKVISVASDHRVAIEEKPEVRKAGGVYYTPSYIVDYIVENTVGKLLKGKTPRQVSDLKVLDPACGSGSFLIGAYTYLLEWHRRWYVDNASEKQRGKVLYEGPSGEWQLTTTEKKRILLDNIYGVDIDSQAVEVTKLSLLLKVLEGETNESINNQLTFFQERALPDLDNIKCGNSLIRTDFYDEVQMSFLDQEEQYRINVFDWEDAFPQVFNRRISGFDAIIGNPPYGAEFKAIEKPYLKSHFAYKKGKPETYIYFFERGVELLAESGMLGYITPNAWLTNFYGEQLRRYLMDRASFKHLVDLEPTKVFRKAVVDTTITILQKGVPKGDTVKTSVWRGTQDHQIAYQFEIKQHAWASDPEALINLNTNEYESELLTKLQCSGETLENIVEYSQGVIPYQTEAEGKANPYIAEDKKGDGWLPLIESASQVRRYEIDQSRAFIYYGSWLQRPRDPKFFLQPKILFHRLRKKLPRQLIGAYDNSESVNRHALSNLVLLPDVPTRDTLFAILGLFNSTLANWWFVKRYGLLMEVGGFKVAKIPLPEHWKDGHDRMVDLVKQMINLHEQLSIARTSNDKNFVQRQIYATDHQIDRLVYKLYGLTEDEIEIVEGKGRERAYS
jgi:type I restriction-modification system DNA methylase subunit/predicted type IV restriction endonuclease